MEGDYTLKMVLQTVGRGQSNCRPAVRASVRANRCKHRSSSYGDKQENG